MISNPRLLLLAAAFLTAPIGATLAQQDTTSSNPAYNHSPRTQPNSPRMDRSSAATDPHTPGATGQTVVPGSGSSMAGSHRVAPNPNSASTTGNAGGGGK
jgi:hypothetical protein